MRSGIVMAVIVLGAAGMVGGRLGAQNQPQPPRPVVSDEAIKNLREAAEAFPQEASTLLRLGQALRARGEFKEAQIWLDKAADVDPALTDKVFASQSRSPSDPALRTTCPESTGPDVIVGEIPVGFRVGHQGDITAIAYTTISCNVGTADVNWFEQTSLHPVIAQNMFRLKNGRFEQIGQSWVKHGFFAETSSDCCTCVGEGGNVLNPGCSDPYGAGLNSTQFRLGPKAEVNAATGVFQWPHTIVTLPQGSNGETEARLQIHDSDLSTSLNPNALYFAEVQYVTQDDAAAGNDNNNASYRQFTVIETTPNVFNVIPTDRTTIQREKAAVYAWQEIDPGVGVMTADVPGDGRFILGYRVTDNGNGTWHYEYALQNLNSDRSGQAFSLALPSGVTASNLGFHDVDYHSGDGNLGVNRSGTDWVPAATPGGMISWTGQPFAQDTNANALRWGTIYNFRFDATRPGVPRPITLALFKPGSPASITFQAIGPDHLPCPADVNADGNVNSADLGLLLGGWGVGGGPADINGDGNVNSADLGLLLGGWGPCP